MEAAAKRAKELKGSQRDAPVLAVGTPVQARPCGRCGRRNHNSSECKFKTATCDRCGKVGHIAPVCRSVPRANKRTFTRKTKWVATTEPSQPQDNQEEYLYVISNKSTAPYKVQLEVKGKPLTMEVDTGAAVSLAPESAVESLLSSSELLPSNVILKTYTGEQIPVKGSLLVDVKYGQQRYTNLKLLVVSGTGPCLMGRDWLRIVRLDWRKIGKVSTTPAPADLDSRLMALQNKYQEVFSDTLGTITPYRAKLSITSDASPDLCHLHYENAWRASWIGWSKKEF